MKENTFGKMVKEVRKHHKLSIKELAEKLGITKKELSRIEKNKDIPQDPFLLLAISKVLRIPIQYVEYMARKAQKCLKDKDNEVSY